MPFSLDTLEVTGEPFLVARDVVSPSVSDDGTLTYLAGVFHAPRELHWVDRAGKTLEVAGLPQIGSSELALSPDLTQVALTAWEGSSRDIWVQDLDRTTKRQLTFTPQEERSPRWSPDGRRLVYYTLLNEPQMYMIDLEGTGDAVFLGNGGRPTFARGGELIVFERFGARGIWYFEFDEAGQPGEPTLILDPPGDESEAVVSPDDQWLAYSGDETGRMEIYITRFPSGEGKWKVSTDGGAAAAWSPDGRELFFVDFEGNLATAKIASGSRPVLEGPERLFDGMSFGLGSEMLFGVGGGGEQLLVVRDQEGTYRSPRLMLVQNWYAEFSDGR